jgi:hypothetical protein
MNIGTVKWFNTKKAMDLSSLRTARRTCSFISPPSSVRVWVTCTRGKGSATSSSAASGQDLGGRPSSRVIRTTRAPPVGGARVPGATREPVMSGRKFRVGQAVEFLPDPGVDRLSKGRYTIVRKLTEEC